MAIVETTWLHSLGSRAIDLLFPPSCVACGSEMSELVDDIVMCTACRDSLPPLGWATCQRCAARVPEIPGDVPVCHRCQEHKIRFDRTLALGAYDGLLRDLVLEMKNVIQSIQPVYTDMQESTQPATVLQVHSYRLTKMPFNAVAEE
jgi:hypothetical protein